MKVRDAFIISLLFLLPCSLQKQNKLAPVINDLSVVARLLNGISLQSDFMRSSQNLNAVVGELLGIGDSNAIPELLKVNVKDLMKDVDAILKDVKGLAKSSNQNAAIIGETVGILKKIDVEKLKKVVGVDMQALNDKWGKAKSVCLTCLEAERLLPVVASLKYVMNTTNDQASKTDMQKHLKYFFHNSSDISLAFKNFQNSKFSDLFEIIGTSSSLQGFPYVCDVTKEFSDHWNAFSLLGQAFTDMKLSLKDLDSVIKKIQASSTDSKNLGAMESMFPIDELADKNLTIGLPNGIGDLKLIFEDLNGKWLKENLADGKDMKMLVTALQPLQKFYENLKPLESSWNKLKEDQKIGEVVGNIATILMNGKIVKSEYFASKSEDIAKCTQTFKPVSDIQCESFNAFYSDLAVFDGNLKILQNTLESTTNSPFLAKIIPFDWDNLVPGVSITPETVEAEVKKLRENQDIQEITKPIFEHSDGLERSKIKEMSEIIKFWPEVMKMHKSSTKIGLIAAMECLNKLNFDYSAAEAFSLLDQGVQALKNQTDAQRSMKVFGEAIGSLITSDKKLKETLSGMKVVRRRRRNAQGPGPKGLLKLADSRKVAQDLGNGVEVLREMSDVFENQERVLKVAKSGDIVDPVIQGIPEMNGKWTVEGKKALEKLVDEVNNLNTNVDKNRTLETIWKLFADAQSVNGAPIESRMLGTSVFETLDKSSDGAVRSAAADFKEFPPLQLDFTGSRRIYLRDAAMVFHPITGFFKDFFSMDISSSTQSSDFSPNYLLFAGAGAGGLALVVALGVGGYYGSKAYKKTMKWKNRERFWIYIWCQDDDWDKLEELILEEKYEELKRLLEKGTYANFFNDGLSMLHFAAYNDGRYRGAAVELLILNGADCRAMSVEMKTPEESVVKVDPDQDDDIKERYRKVMAAFKKYKGKSFKQKIPELMPWSKFIVCSIAGNGSAEFELKYKSQIKFYQNCSGATHCIVDVDDNGVYHCDMKKPNAMVTFYGVVFGPVIAVSSEWPKLCMKSVKNFYKDYDCRVKKVEFNGKIYTNVDKLKEFARGRHIKYGHGINLTYLSNKSKEERLDSSIGRLGFVVSTENVANWKEPVPVANPLAKSFYRPDMNANFIVYDGKSIDEFSKQLVGVNLKDYTVMSLNEFTVFALEMKMTGGKNSSQFPIKAATPTNKTKTTSTSKTASSAMKTTSTVKSTQ